MKKPLLILSLSALPALLPAWCAAQTSLTIYGILDAGLVQDWGGPNGRVTRMIGGVQSGSRLGFKGLEDLGGGMSARFVLENGFNLDDGTLAQSGTLFNRQAYAGIGGRWGNLNLGRQLTPHFTTLDQIDPFSTGLAGSAANLMPTVPRMSNTIKYTTPAWSGFDAELAYGFGEAPGNFIANRQVGASIGYSSGPLVVKYALHRADNAGATDRSRLDLLGGRWDFGFVAASLAVARNRGLGADDREYLLGVTVPIGPGTLMASYIRNDDRSLLNQDTNQWALGYSHSLSRRTNLYTAYGHLNNAARFKVGNATDAGTGDRAFNLGIRHTF